MNRGQHKMGASYREDLRKARDAWARRYKITSVRGRIYTRPMVRVAIIRACERKTIFMTEPAARRRILRAVDDLLSDARWMQIRHGQTPGSLASDAVKRLFGE